MRWSGWVTGQDIRALIGVKGDPAMSRVAAGARRASLWPADLLALDNSRAAEPCACTDHGDRIMLCGRHLEWLSARLSRWNPHEEWRDPGKWSGRGPLGDELNMPDGAVGWNGERHEVPIVGPIRCPDDWADLPTWPDEVAECEVITSWECPFCGADNEVHGEGAAYSWMECATCHEYAYLTMGAV